MDFALFVKGRYNFEIGRKKQFPVEAYGLFHFGPSFAFKPSKAGFNLGISPGWQIMLHKRIGAFSEMGFVHRKVKPTRLLSSRSDGALR